MELRIAVDNAALVLFASKPRPHRVWSGGFFPGKSISPKILMMQRNRDGVKIRQDGQRI